MDHELVKVAKVNAVEPMVRREVESVMEGGNPSPEPIASLGIYGLVGGTDYRVKGREGRVHLFSPLQQEHDNAYLLGRGEM